MLEDCLGCINLLARHTHTLQLKYREEDKLIARTAQRSLHDFVPLLASGSVHA